MNQQPDTTPQPLPSTPSTPQLQTAAKTPTSSPPASSLWPSSPLTPESDLGTYSDTTPSTAGISCSFSASTLNPTSCAPHNQLSQPSSSSSHSPASNIPTRAGSILDRPSPVPPRSSPPLVAAIEPNLHHNASVERLPYDIHAYSSHSPAYHPRNILIDRPTDQGSRWSSGTNNHLQYITIKLDKMAIVRILYGRWMV
ncbi:Muskelin N-terminus-domain-containing protein, partial [Endogone sp. FLAS-F59071]